MDQAVTLGLMLFLGFMATEGTVEYLLGTAFEKVEALKPYSWLLMYVSVAVGIFFAIHYGLDAVNVVFGLPSDLVGEVITGIVVGRGANFVSEVWDKFLG